MDNNQEIMFEELKKKGWNIDQLDQQQIALEKGFTLIDLDPSKWNYSQMRQQRFALEKGFTLIDLDPDKWTWQQMREQRFALKDGVTLIDLDPSKWTWREMEKYILALKTNNIAENVVADFIYSVNNSNKIKTVCDNCNDVSEFFSTSLKIESSIFLKVVAIDNPSTELLKIERNTKNEFWVRINIVNNEGEDFITNIKIKTKTDLAKSVSAITDFIANIQAFSKYVDDLSELI